MLKKIIPFIILAALVVAGVRLVQKKQAAIRNQPRPETRLPAVESAVPEAGTFAVTTTRLGTIVAKQPARLAARISAHIIEIKVREGDRVAAGEILVRLDDRRERDRLATVKADLSAARTQLAADAATFARDRRLFAAKAISQETLDHSRARRDASRARVTALEKALDTARTDLSYTLIKAPAAGVITARLADPGDLATPGKTLLGFENTAAGYLVRVNLPQSELSRFRPGSPARILPAPEGKAETSAIPIPATVSRLHPAVSRSSLATLEIDLPQRPFNLPTGAVVNVRLQLRPVTGWKLPGRAVLENVNQAYVFILGKAGRIHVVPVTIKARHDDWYVVDGTLEEDSRVAVGQESLLLRLHEKMKVRVIQ